MKSLDYRRFVVGYSKAKQVAVLYDAGSDGRPAFISQIMNRLKKDGKNVVALGFFNQKRMPEGVQAIEGVHYCSRKSFSIWMRPKSQAVGQFLEQSYDLLIDLTTKGPFMVKYVAGITRASYKAGVHHPDFLTIYDLLLHIEDQTTDEKLADHAIHYLKIIKTPEEK